MKRSSVSTAVMAAITLATNVAIAEGDMEKCTVVDENGKGLIKAGKASCNTSKHSCNGKNEAGDPEAWIYVPTGECGKINAGDFSGIDQKTKDKIEGAR